MSVIASPEYGSDGLSNYGCAVTTTDRPPIRGPRTHRRNRAGVLVGTLAVVVSVLAVGIVSAGEQSRQHGPSGQLRISSGSTSGVYHAFAGLLADHLHQRDGRLRVSVLPSTGSIENLHRIDSGAADCAITAADAATSALDGTAPWFTHQVGLVAVARIYDDYVQLVARPSAGITSVADLHGKRVSLGAPESGVQLIANRVLHVSGLGPRGLTALSLGLHDSMLALQAGTIDAFFWSGGVPTSSIATLLQSGKARLVPLGPVAAAMTRGYPTSYRTATIPISPYHLSAAVATFAVPNFVVCSPHVSADVVEALTSTIFADQRSIAERIPAVNVIDLRTAIATDPVPLHPAAARWYRSRKN